MTGEDRLRSHLQHTAASLPTGPGSLSAVHARAAQMQRRRNAVRGGAGAFALVAVAAIGIVSLQDRGVQDYATDADAASEDFASEDFAVEEQTPLGTVGDFADDGDDSLAGAQDPSGSVEDFERAEESDEPEVAMATEAQTSPQDTEADASQTSDESPSSDSDGRSAVFASAVSAIAPPAEAEGTSMRYSFSGAHALARSDDEWYAYDGAQWQLVGLPENIEVVAVDLSGSERIAILGVVRPFECAIEHVVGVSTADGWSFARIDDGTPPMVNSELLHARVRVTDSAVEVERIERLWLYDECADPQEYADPSGDAAELVADLEQLGEIQRQSWLVAEFEPDFTQHWPRVASDDASAAALQRSELQWTRTEAPLYTVEARELTAAARPSVDDAIAVALHETTMLEVATSVEVSDGMAVLRRGDQSWDVCPIPDVDEVHGEIGWAGEHLAVVVGKPEQTLFVVKRTE